MDTYPPRSFAPVRPPGEVVSGRHHRVHHCDAVNLGREDILQQRADVIACEPLPEEVFCLVVRRIGQRVVATEAGRLELSALPASLQQTFNRTNVVTTHVQSLTQNVGVDLEQVLVAWTQLTEGDSALSEMEIHTVEPTAVVRNHGSHDFLSCAPHWTR